MKVRYLAYIAVLVTAAIWAQTAWSATPPRNGAAGPTPATPTRAYVVRPGDSGWWKLAHAQGLQLQQVLAVNHATAATPLRVGQTIRLPIVHDTSKHAKPAPKKPVKRQPPATR
jgi:hypothetical protein